MWRPAGQGRARLSRSDSMHVLTRIGQARQSRYFAVSRTGEWPRGKAEQLRYEYLHRAWGVLLAEGAVFLALTPLAPNWLREFIVGGWVVFVGWLLWHQVVVESGSSTRDMGALAEQWTSNELRLLRDRGWRVINHVVLRHWDIDHVAVGPGGVLVVQTKWSSDEAGMHDLATVTRQLKKDAEDVRLMLKARLAGAPARAVVVVWGPAARRDAAIPSQPVDGVHVVAGRRLKELLEGFGDCGVKPDAIDAAWATLRDQVGQRDARDQRLAGPPPRSVKSRLTEMGLVCVVTASGLEASFLGLRWLHLPICLALVAAELVAGAAASRHREAQGVRPGMADGPRLLLAPPGSRRGLYSPQVESSRRLCHQVRTFAPPREGVIAAPRAVTGAPRPGRSGSRGVHGVPTSAMWMPSGC